MAILIVQMEAEADAVRIKIMNKGKERIFAVSKKQITACSPYFAAAFEGTSQGANDKETKLYDVATATFEQFLLWLDWHSNSENSRVECDPYGPLYLESLSYHGICELAINMYLFAHAYDVPQLRVDATDRLTWLFRRITKSTFSLPADIVGRVYGEMPKGSPLRMILIDGFYFWGFNDTMTFKSLMGYPKEFLVDVMLRSAKILNDEDEGVTSLSLSRGCDPRRFFYPCYYHDHKEYSEIGDCLETRIPGGF
ncbi:hypothetical protein CC78DRAFT_540278 [Lojkania enalia]|uniref:BTB domain-containing protein n=1 Tax=Lojkania enalia TaxID=147567 RepID=A0A9P4TN53_9PLEO|nr:hypothetical protein CC78DRAFT_540278 [Didymosphaeria enalia]